MFQVHITDKAPRKSPMSLGRCDQCSKRHRKCSLDLPACSNCQKLGISCTRERTFKYVLSSNYTDINKTRPKKHNLISLFSTKEPKKTEEEDLSNDSNFKFQTKTKRDFGKPVIINIQKNTSLVTLETTTKTETETQCFNEENDIYETLKNWQSRSYTRSDLIYFSSVAGIQLTNLKSIRFTILNKLLNKRILPREGRRPKLLHIEPTEIDKEIIFNNAISAYFHYVNPFFPLFTKGGFNLKSRSTLLKYSLWRVGLQFLPRSTYNETIAHMLDSEILNLVKLSRVTLSLGTIQALLALRNGIFEFPLYESLSSFYALATTLVTLLGLHKTPPTFLSPSNIFERKLALKQTLIKSSELLFKRGIDFLNFNDEPFYSSFVLNSNSNYGNLWKCQELLRDLPSSITEMDESFETEKSDSIYIETSKEKLYEYLLWILSHCSYKGSKILRQCALRFLDLSYSNRNHEATLNEFESKLNYIFIWGISELDSIENSLAGLDNISSTFKPELSLFILQVRLVLMLRSRFLRIQLIDYAIGFNLPVTNSLSGTSLAKKGVQDSIILVDLIALIGKGPFLLDRDFMLGIATRFLAQYCQCSKRDLISINLSIVKANNELTKVQEYAITGYFIEGYQEILDYIVDARSILNQPVD